MPVIAMRATSAVEHPDADTLRVYTFEAPGHGSLQVVANQDFVYEAGDVAIVALPGTKLLDGLTIKRTKLRGVESRGMAMGPTDAEPGMDLSEGRCHPETKLDESRLVKWTSIELLHNVVGDVLAKAKLADEPPPEVEYRAKVKLHGTCCAVQVLRDGRIVAQGRNRVLKLEDDNMGFAAWVLDNRAHFEALVDPTRDLFLFGEWCGSGIQRGVSICAIGRKIFAVFAAQLGDHLVEAARLVTCPGALAELTPTHADIFVLPWHGGPVAADFADLEDTAKTLNEVVAAVEAKDPWVHSIFGIEGTGEGVVLYPQLESDDREDITSLMFKAKGDKHRVRKSKKAVEVAPEVLASVEAFVATFATEARLAQGLAEACHDNPTMKDMGAFLQWVGRDIRKESGDDLEAAGLEWRHVGKAVTSAAKKWFIANHLTP